MKVGIFTYHRAHNYGAYIQACALCNRLNQENNIECEIIDFNMQKEVNQYSLSRISKKVKYLRPFKYAFKKSLWSCFEDSIDDNIMRKSIDHKTSDSIEDFIQFVDNKYDVIIAGSDEIWKVDGYRKFPTPYFLPKELKCKKVSYAASSRTDFTVLDENTRDYVKDILNDFEYIGVREQYTADKLSELLGTSDKINVNCDPSFLYDFEIAKKSIPDLLKDNYKLNSNKKTIVVMTNDKILARNVRRVCHNKYNLVSVFDYHIGYKNLSDLSPKNWLNVIANADLVITTYFHGTCLSIINQTPFISIGSKARSSKIESIFAYENNFAYRYIQDTEVFISNSDLLAYIEDFMTPINTRKFLNERREEFKSFIKILNNIDY